MKITRTYSLDEKIVKILDKMKQKSKIIESLLRDYFVKAKLMEKDGQTK